MTQDDIIRMAREAGFGEYLLRVYRADEGVEHLALAAYEAGAAAERAACADICYQHASVEGIAQRCAEQIRARGKT
jgi:hypothetical protein